MPRSLLNRLLDDLCTTPSDDPKFLEIAIKVKHAYETKCSKPKVVRKKKVKVCLSCGGSEIECRDAGDEAPHSPLV